MGKLSLVVGWLAAFAIFLFLDYLWLGWIARDFYRSRLTAVVDFHVNMPVAALFYILHVIGVMIFVVVPAVQTQATIANVLLRGALYGFFTYATYDLTNLATVKNWPVMMVCVDIVWGAFLNAWVGLAGFTAARLVR